ncbi:bifunctional adenosylcobinamide kinase/adenosylcobinamide-phosphate guanylyltransferase [Intrasporangium calvum]|uniref:Adenosylcobinamide kinase n=1 Tax=Intrasporangium calvum TaxID=53358 RepID=A0ABT5GJH5_9MICO|nr:bifunctional adenosylcobinamide kinase/adenosylcobinamide-phosphate guanylyltransferase [Intrasporangium calvum]MDC5698398.1 bifunctional adenosylcobinamide kinase/adenosylcobinamide-phosphate guanylyltransferase [Intrasporangium calvum]
MTARTTTLVTGPVRSGKSRHAEELLALHRDVLYVATGRPAADDDDAWAERVRSHQHRRPTSWRTLETVDLDAALSEAPGPVLIDCLGTWLTAQVDLVGWDDLPVAAAHLRERTDSLVESLDRVAHPVVIVTNEVGWSLVPMTASGRFFQDELGRLNARVAHVAAAVHLVVAGRVLDLSTLPVVPQSPPPRTLDA